MARDLEKLAVDIERPIGRISRGVFWLLFIVYTAILVVAGWYVYTHILVGGTDHRIPLDDHIKDGIILGLSIVLLGIMLAAITRNSIRNAIYRSVDRKNKNS